MGLLDLDGLATAGIHPSAGAGLLRVGSTIADVMWQRGIAAERERHDQELEKYNQGILANQEARQREAEAKDLTASQFAQSKRDQELSTKVTSAIGNNDISQAQALMRGTPRISNGKVVYGSLEALGAPAPTPAKPANPLDQALYEMSGQFQKNPNYKPVDQTPIGPVESVQNAQARATLAVPPGPDALQGMQVASDEAGKQAAINNLQRNAAWGGTPQTQGAEPPSPEVQQMNRSVAGYQAEQARVAAEQARFQKEGPQRYSLNLGGGMPAQEINADEARHSVGRANADDFMASQQPMLDARLAALRDQQSSIARLPEPAQSLARGELSRQVEQLQIIQSRLPQIGELLRTGGMNPAEAAKALMGGEDLGQKQSFQGGENDLNRANKRWIVQHTPHTAALGLQVQLGKLEEQKRAGDRSDDAQLNAEINQWESSEAQTKEAIKAHRLITSARDSFLTDNPERQKAAIDALVRTAMGGNRVAAYSYHQLTDNLGGTAAQFDQWLHNRTDALLAPSIRKTLIDATSGLGDELSTQLRDTSASWETRFGGNSKYATPYYQEQLARRKAAIFGLAGGDTSAPIPSAGPGGRVAGPQGRPKGGDRRSAAVRVSGPVTGGGSLDDLKALLMQNAPAPQGEVKGE